MNIKYFFPKEYEKYDMKGAHILHHQISRRSLFLHFFLSIGFDFTNLWKTLCQNLIALIFIYTRVRCSCFQFGKRLMRIFDSWLLVNLFELIFEMICIKSS